VSQLLLGVDGGATKTIALVADGSGTVLGTGRAGSSDIHSEVPPSRAVDNVLASVREALAAADVGAADLGACVFGLCGADWPEDFAYFRASLAQQLGLPGEPVIMNDAFNSLRAGTADGIGVALVLGTGGAIAARGPAGAEWFSGERLERAGAMELGRVAYDALVRAEYADGPRPAYEASALAVFDVDSIEGLVYAITRSGGAGWRSVARLAPALMQAAHDGDRGSQQVVREHGQRLADYVRAAGSRVGLDSAARRLVLAGGVLRGLSPELRDALAQALPDYTVTNARLEPAHGALLTAADRAGLRPTEERLVETGPPPAFFATTDT
jgi:N-acetylglucosamine kinase-like BadF-type ATPase